MPVAMPPIIMPIFSVPSEFVADPKTLFGWGFGTIAQYRPIGSAGQVLAQAQAVAGVLGDRNGGHRCAWLSNRRPGAGS